MQVTEARYLTDRGLLLYVFDMGAWMGYGPGVLPGTDVETYRFVVSRGFKDWDEYKAAQGVARAYGGISDQ